MTLKGISLVVVATLIFGILPNPSQASGLWTTSIASQTGVSAQALSLNALSPLHSLTAKISTSFWRQLQLAALATAIVMGHGLQAQSLNDRDIIHPLPELHLPQQPISAYLQNKIQRLIQETRTPLSQFIDAHTAYKRTWGIGPKRAIFSLSDTDLTTAQDMMDKIITHLMYAATDDIRERDIHLDISNEDLLNYQVHPLKPDSLRWAKHTFLPQYFALFNFSFDVRPLAKVNGLEDIELRPVVRVEHKSLPLAVLDGPPTTFDKLVIGENILPSWIARFPSITPHYGMLTLNGRQIVAYDHEDTDSQVAESFYKLFKKYPELWRAEPIVASSGLSALERLAYRLIAQSILQARHGASASLSSENFSAIFSRLKNQAGELHEANHIAQYQHRVFGERPYRVQEAELQAVLGEASDERLAQLMTGYVIYYTIYNVDRENPTLESHAAGIIFDMNRRLFIGWKQSPWHAADIAKAPAAAQATQWSELPSAIQDEFIDHAANLSPDDWIAVNKTITQDLMHADNAYAQGKDTVLWNRLPPRQPAKDGARVFMIPMNVFGAQLICLIVVGLLVYVTRDLLYSALVGLLWRFRKPVPNESIDQRPMSLPYLEGVLKTARARYSDYAKDAHIAQLELGSGEYGYIPFVYNSYAQAIFMLRAYEKTLAGKSILDVGSGPGYFQLFARMLGKTVDGLERNAELVCKAQAQGLHVIEGDLFNLPASLKRYDFTFSLYVFQWLRNPVGTPEDVSPQAAGLTGMARLTVPGGLTILVTPQGQLTLTHDDIDDAGYHLEGRHKSEAGDWLILRRLPVTPLLRRMG
jgi:SAM-dependent methyltransferase